ncbi:MAG: GNAT family N-acetyltransferase [Deltaproteobacteria bacterium]|nr:GNAT family N-acetyltransferase [Deltaproteobacteria bacterium]
MMNQEGLEIEIRNDLRPGDLGAIVQLHGECYSAEYGFDHTFEPYVAVPLSEFVLRANRRERIWIVTRGGRVGGSVAIVTAAESEAQLRWLLLVPPLRGRGLGRRLVGEALAFCRCCGYESVFLWTLAHLEKALGVYRYFGFQVRQRHTHRIWGQELTEERHVLDLTP